MKFKVGDFVVLARSDNPELGFLVGEEGIVIEAGVVIGRDNHGNSTRDDYGVKMSNGEKISAPEHHLRKRQERGIPKEVREIFEIPVNA